jgi:hypothetical protein
MNLYLDDSRDMTPRAIVRAIENFSSANVLVENQFNILNHWR